MMIQSSQENSKKTENPKRDFELWQPSRKNTMQSELQEEMCFSFISLGIQIVKYTAYDFFTEKSFDFEQTAR